MDPAALKLLVSFGSIIGRAGLRGQADYATANDWLTEMTTPVRRVAPAVPLLWRSNGQSGRAQAWASVSACSNR